MDKYLSDYVKKEEVEEDYMVDDHLARQLLCQQIANPNLIDEKLKKYMLHQLRITIYSFIPLNLSAKELAKRWGVYEECDYNSTRFSAIYLQYLYNYPPLLEKLGTDKKVLHDFLENKILNSPYMTEAEIKLAEKFGLDTSKVERQEFSSKDEKDINDELLPF